MPIYSIIGLVLFIWASYTLVSAIFNKDRGEIIRAGIASCIAALIIAIGYVGR